VFAQNIVHLPCTFLPCQLCCHLLQATLQLLVQLGELYEREHEKDLADVIRFGSQAHDAGEAVFLQALQGGAVVYEAAAGLSSSSSDPTNNTAAAAAAAAVFQVPGPFSQRPRVGSRLVVRDNFSVALHALCAELSSWQSGPRAMSASLLKVNLVLAEAAAERHLQVRVVQEKLRKTSMPLNYFKLGRPMHGSRPFQQTKLHVTQVAMYCADYHQVLMPHDVPNLFKGQGTV
jgi:hypothetical protein